MEKAYKRSKTARAAIDRARARGLDARLSIRVEKPKYIPSYVVITTTVARPCPVSSSTGIVDMMEGY